MNLVRFVFQLLHLYFECRTPLDKNVVPTFILNTHEFNNNFVSRRFLVDNKLSSSCIVVVSCMKGVIEKSRFCNSVRVACYVSCRIVYSA